MNQERDYSSSFVSPSTQDHILGRLDATVALVMYGDYQCSQSADGYRLVKAMQRQLVVSFGENYLCFIFRHFPQIQHSHAQRAAEAAEAAAAQGRFWQMHNLLFDRQSALGDADLIEYASIIRLDISRFLQELSKRTHLDRINLDIESGLQSGVERTPALFVNGIRYTSTWKVEMIASAITGERL